MLWSTGTGIQELQHGRTTRRREAQDSPSFDPHDIVTTGIRERESKRATNTEQAKRLNPHLIGSTGVENKRGTKGNGIRTLSTNSSWNMRRLKKKRHDPTIQTHS
jgi:hypothetical protein